MVGINKGIVLVARLTNCMGYDEEKKKDWWTTRELFLGFRIFWKNDLEPVILLYQY